MTLEAVKRFSLASFLFGKTWPGALLSAALLILAFPPFEQGYLAWVALIPLTAVVLKNSPAEAFKAGFIFGLLFNLYVNFYLQNVLFAFLPAPPALLLMILIVAYTSLFYGLFGLSSNLAARLKNPAFTTVLVPSFWMLFEFLRSLGFLGYNVGYIGYSQWRYSSLLNLAATYGYWGLPFLIVFAQSIAVMALKQKLKSKTLLALSTLFIILFLSGLFTPSLFKVKGAEKNIKVSLVQGNSSMEQVLYRREEVAAVYLDLIKSSAQTGANLIVLPETIFDLDAAKINFHHPALQKTAGQYKTNILYGARLEEGEHLYNIITLCQSGRPDAPLYKKIRLVPFVEYFPAEGALNRLLKLKLQVGAYTPGREKITFTAEDIKLAGVICFESYFGSHTRSFALKGAEHLFVLTNDGWFGRSIGLDQHAQAAAIRAAEMGIGVTQVANSGLSIVFDYRGKEIYRLARQAQETATLDLGLTTRPTLYVLLGDYFPLLWAIISALLLLTGRRFKPAG